MAIQTNGGSHTWVSQYKIATKASLSAARVGQESEDGTYFFHGNTDATSLVTSYLRRRAEVRIVIIYPTQFGG